MRSNLLLFLPPLAAGAILRAFSLVRFLKGSPFAHHLFSDGHAYWERAAAILAGDAPREAFYQAPLYPYALALFRAVAGANLPLLYAAQHLCGLLSVFLVTAIALRALPRRAAAAAGVIYALLPYPVYFEQKLAPISVALPIALTALLLLDRARTGRGWVAAGAATGLVTLARANLLLFAAITAIWIARRAGARAVLLFAASAAVVVLPVTVRNAVVGGGFVPVAANGGEVFYHGNNGNAAGAMGKVPELGADIVSLAAESRAAAARDLGRSVNAAEASRYWFGRGLAWIAGHGADSFRLEMRKARILLSGRFTPISNFFDFETERFPGVPRPFIYLHYPLLFLALLALFDGAMRRRVPAPALLFGAAQIVTVLLFFGCTRYVIPLAPIAALLAGAAIAGGRPGPRAAVPIAAAVLLLLAADLGWKREWATPYAQLGSIRLEEEKGDEAVALFEEAVRIAPMEVIHAQNLARAEWFVGRVDRAAATIVAAVERGIADGRTLGYLGTLYLQLERYDEAEKVLDEAIRLEPNRALSHFMLGRVLVRQRRWEEAERAFLRAVELEPDMLDAHRHLYRIYQGPLPDPEKMDREMHKVFELHGWE
ncbi:MAG: tetratricopeptide repeat protein [Candidatus Eisenbacteria bacterium]|nr:tetratricopeptide repeat protein [Candidatus Eisenbacteria bacterium]